jgi:hypothetical protein
MRRGLLALSFVLFASIALAQGAEYGTVLKWESKPYSQSAHIIRDHIVYWVQVGDASLQIARRSDKAEMVVGERVQCRIDKSHIFVVNEKGKETKYDIVGSEPIAPAVK